MATSTIESYLPKTASYINWVFKNISENRGGHHNHVATQYVLNTNKALVDQSTSELAQTDEAIFEKLHTLDDKPDCVLIVRNEEFTDFAEIADIYGQGCNYPTSKGVDGFQVDFDVIAIKDENEAGFHVVYQSLERSDNIKAYSGIEMEKATIYGCDADQSYDLLIFMDHDENIFEGMDAIAKKRCFDWFENNIEE